MVNGKWKRMLNGEGGMGKGEGEGEVPRQNAKEMRNEKREMGNEKLGNETP